MIGLLSDLRLSPEQRREVYTNTFLQHDYDGAVAALRVLYPSVNHTDVPFIKPATSKDQQHRDRVRQPSAKATDTLATLKKSIMKASSPEEVLSIMVSSTKTRTPPRTKSRTAVRRDRRKRNTNKPLNPVATSGNLPWEDHLGKLMCFSCGETGQWSDIEGSLRNLTCGHCKGSMLESLLLREQIYDGYDVIDDEYMGSPAGAAHAAAASSDAPVNLVRIVSSLFPKTFRYFQMCDRVRSLIPTTAIKCGSL